MNKETLAQVRQELDALDEQIHQLLKQRTKVVERVAQAKARANDGVVGFAVRPGREAQMIRNFCARHEDPLPFIVVNRLWREIINAMTRLQSSLSVAMQDEDPAFGHDDFVRRFERVHEHWGTVTPVARCASVEDMLGQINAETGVMGVLDVAGRQDWWQPLVDWRAKEGRNDVFIVAPLPFVALPEEQVEAFALSPQGPEESGDDLSVIAVPMGADCPVANKLTLRIDGAASSLLVVDGFIDHNDPALAKAIAQAGGWFLGAYARPLEITA